MKNYLKPLAAGMILLYSTIGNSLYTNTTESSKSGRIFHHLGRFLAQEYNNGKITRILNQVYEHDISSVVEKHKTDFENRNVNNLANVTRSIISQESEGKIRAYSKAKAKSLMQLIDSTARNLDLKKDKYVDEVYDTKKTVDAGLKHLGGFIDRFGSLEYGLLAYNWGPTNVARLLKKVGKDVNFWEIDKKYLPKESYNFVAQVHAWMMLIEHKDMYGIVITPKNIKLIQYKVKKGDTLGSIARKFNLTVDEVFEQSILRSKDRLPIGYELNIPVSES